MIYLRIQKQRNKKGKIFLSVYFYSKSFLDVGGKYEIL
jgi:hypothetical protein